MRRKNRFGEYISKLRLAKGISLEQLSDGLCDVSLISRFERGEREPEKLLQNRFLTRLGVVPENYENFLYYKDYCRWEKRQGIIHSILDEHLEEAKHLLEEYYQKYDMNYSLERQFYLAMLAQIKTNWQHYLSRRCSLPYRILIPEVFEIVSYLWKN